MGFLIVFVLAVGIAIAARAVVEMLVVSLSSYTDCVRHPQWRHAVLWMTYVVVMISPVSFVY